MNYMDRAFLLLPKLGRFCVKYFSKNRKIISNFTEKTFQLQDLVMKRQSISMGKYIYEIYRIVNISDFSILSGHLDGSPNCSETCPGTGNLCQSVWRPVRTLGQPQKPIIIKQL
jgi:hypothetical protein